MPAISPAPTFRWMEDSALARSSHTVDPADPLFAGHFPGNPVLPGVCLIHHACRIALTAPPAPGLRLVGIESAQFLAPVRPGDEVVFTATWNRLETCWQSTTVVTVGDHTVARNRLLFREAVPG